MLHYTLSGLECLKACGIVLTAASLKAVIHARRDREITLLIGCAGCNHKDGSNTCKKREREITLPIGRAGCNHKDGHGPRLACRIC
jgi:hypothetical protein